MSEPRIFDYGIVSSVLPAREKEFCSGILKKKKNWGGGGVVLFTRQSHGIMSKLLKIQGAKLIWNVNAF